MKSIDINISDPHELAPALRNAAEEYRHSANELREAWQDDGAGRIWDEYADVLEAAAESVEKIAYRLLW